MQPDGDRQTVLLGELDDLVGPGDRVGGAGHQGAPARCAMPSRYLVAQRADRRRWRADPDQTGIDDGLGEFGVLGQEAVSGMDGVCTTALGHVEKLVDDQVRLGGCITIQGVRLIGCLDVQGVTVGVGVDRDAGKTGVPAGTGDPMAISPRFAIRTLRTPESRE